jgi:hypothetical protein
MLKGRRLRGLRATIVDEQDTSEPTGQDQADAVPTAPVRFQAQLLHPHLVCFDFALKVSAGQTIIYR